MRRALVLVVVAAVTALPAVAQKPSATPLSGGQIFSQTLKSTVWITSPIEVTVGGSTRQMLATGTGSVIDLQNRLVVTNYHVVRDQKEVTVMFPAFDKKSKELIAERAQYMS